MDTGRYYKLTDETIEFDGHTLHRIICTKSFHNVMKGTLGGFIEGYGNLCNEAWVDDEAKVYHGAFVNCQARVCGHACVSHCAYISDRAIVGDNASVSGNVFIGGTARICNDTLIKPTRGTIVIKGATRIIGDAVIESKHDWIVFKNWWSSGRFFTWTRSNDMWAVGCFYGTGKELIAKAYKGSKVSGREYERIVKYVERIKKGSKPSLWWKILFNLSKLCK